MRRDVLELRAFYATALGRAARDMVVRQLVEAWGDARGLDLLGLGYTSPFLDLFRARARRVVLAMPAAQGVETWPMGGANLACLADETALPFPGALFDRVLIMHGLEEAQALSALMDEVHRVLSPSGRVIIATVNRNGLWAGAEGTPYGHGRPFTRAQLEATVRDAGLEPLAWSRALYTPPWPPLAPYAEMIEQTASRLIAPASGLILLEAVKQTFAIRPKGSRARVVSPVLRPSPAMPKTAKDALGNGGVLRHT